MDHEAELLKGNTQTLILAVLREEPRHGYAIAREIERRSEDGVRFKDGTLYPALQQLERQGLIVGNWEPAENAPPRKVYRLTEAGQEALAQRISIWSDFVRKINRILSNAPEVQGA
jgi:PadR family transcriptional regulator, regulatory protein PadR